MEKVEAVYVGSLKLKELNNFIKDKEIIDIQYIPINDGLAYSFYAMVWYRV